MITSEELECACEAYWQAIPDEVKVTKEWSKVGDKLKGVIQKGVLAGLESFEKVREHG